MRAHSVPVKVKSVRVMIVEEFFTGYALGSENLEPTLGPFYVSLQNRFHSQLLHIKQDIFAIHGIVDLYQPVQHDFAKLSGGALKRRKTIYQKFENKTQLDWIST